MHLPSPLFTLLSLPLLLPSIPALPLSPQDPLTTTPCNLNLKIPTRRESTILARRLLSLTPTGVLSTIFPANASLSAPRLPRGLSDDIPIALPDYIATCEESAHPGDPTLLALSVSTSTKNAVAGSNVSLSVSWWDEYTRLAGHSPWSPASLPRMSLLGYLEEISHKEVEAQSIVSCYTSLHADSRLWLPGDKGAAHTGKWMRMRVVEVYWIGGFGDRAFIGWFDPEEWRGVRREQWEGVRLPGEEE